MAIRAEETGSDCWIGHPPNPKVAGQISRPSFLTLTIGDPLGSWHRSHHVSYHDYKMVSHSGHFALYTTSGQGMDTCIE